MKENTVTKWLAIIVVIVVAIAIALYAYAINSKPVLTEISIDIPQKQFVATGKKLTRAEVWIVPTGTNITEADYSKYVELSLESSEEGVQKWSGAIPIQPFIATALIVRGYNEKGMIVGTKQYPYIGATEVSSVFAQFWQPVTPRPRDK
jgi:hypothetical protein